MIMTAQQQRAQQQREDRELVGCWIRNRWMFIMADLNLELSAIYLKIASDNGITGSKAGSF
jgi:hypothetical protein